MECRLSRWKPQKNGERCRLLTCGGRKILECLSHDWWKALSLPHGTRPSDVCGRGCTEDEIVIKAEDGPLVQDSKRVVRPRRRHQ